MNLAETVAAAAPFLLAYLIQGLGKGMPALAEGVLRVTLGPGDEVTGFAKECAVNLAVRFYNYISFIVSLLIGTVSAMEFILQTTVRSLAYIVAVAFVALTIVFFMRWHPLNIPSGTQEAKRREREMGYATFGMTTAMFALTFIAKYLSK